MTNLNSRGRPKSIKRIVIISDFHSGHVVGLTPRSWQFRFVKNDITKRNKYALIQRECWNWYSRQIKEIRKEREPYLLAVNGDCIDGRGVKSGGTELITTDRDCQCEMAVDVIKQWNCNNIIMTYGTGYHSGNYEDFENQIAKSVKAKKIGSHEWFTVDGITFDMKHKVSSSGIPHGRFTAVSKAKLWGNLWAETGMTPKSDIVIRSHTHFYSETRDRDGIAIITPALQAMGSKYGARQCEGLIDYGFVVIDVNNGKIENVDVRLAKISSQQVKPIKI